MIHKQTNLSDDFQVFFVELELKMNEVELSEEKVSYPAGNRSLVKKTAYMHVIRRNAW